MAYIGTPVQQALTKVTSQSFNGTGSQTVFTLNRAVNTGEELEVFVNNVQQEPGVGKSYTATGTTLTFDAAPSSGTGNIYVIYRGLAEVTRRLEHDPNAALAATTGTFSGGLAGFGNTAGSSTSDGFGFNQIKFSDGAYNDQPRGPNKVSMYQDTYGEILMYFEYYEKATRKFLKAIMNGGNEWYIYQTYIKLGICYIELNKYELALENLKEGKVLAKKSKSDPETKQKWLSIADLFLAEIQR